MKIYFIIETILIALYSGKIFREELYLKGGQALRIKEKIRNRFSADIDFSVPRNISNEDVFFESLKDALIHEFFVNGYHLFDFKPTRRPKIKKNDTPDFWQGWAVSFKLIEKAKRNLPIEKLRLQALIPEDTASPQIEIDISEYEYCGSIETTKLNLVDVQCYSRAALLVEKVRALCQQHGDYQLKKIDERARDYYDIERLWDRSLQENQEIAFLEECARILPEIFKAKEVSESLLDKIFDLSFLEVQQRGWLSVEQTVSGKIQGFDYYVQTLKDLIEQIKSRRQR